MRLIDADALIDFMKSVITRQRYDNLTISRTLTVKDVLEAVISELDGTSLDGYENAPTIDPVKHGRWIEHGKDDNRCSLCGWGVWVNTNNYCPNCGASMKGEQNG